MTAEQHDPTPDQSAPVRRHRLELRCPDGNPRSATVHLDGEQLNFVSRVELVMDAQAKQVEARLTIDARLIEIDADAAAFVTAHTATDTDTDAGTVVHNHVTVQGKALTADAVLAKATRCWPPHRPC